MSGEDQEYRPSNHLGRMAEDLATLRADMRYTVARLENIERELKVMTDITNRWKGATVILLGLGSLAGWAATFWTNLKGH